MLFFLFWIFIGNVTEDDFCSFYLRDLSFLQSKWPPTTIFQKLEPHECSFNYLMKNIKETTDSRISLWKGPSQVKTSFKTCIWYEETFLTLEFPKIIIETSFVFLSFQRYKTIGKPSKQNITWEDFIPEDVVSVFTRFVVCGIKGDNFQGNCESRGN